MAETLVRDEIVCTFGTAADTRVNIRTSDPADSVTGEVVNTVMETAIAQNVLQNTNGNPVTDALGAKRMRVTEEVLF